jgi:hypothetical protein
MQQQAWLFGAGLRMGSGVSIAGKSGRFRHTQAKAKARQLTGISLTSANVQN